MFYIEDGRENFFQWDFNQRLIVNDNSVDKVHFCNKTDDCSLVCEVFEEDGVRLVNVPNILLQDSWTIRAYAYCTNHTKIEKRFKVIARSKPDDYVYTETEVLDYNTLLNRMNEIDENIGQTVKEYLEENPVEVDLSGYATEDYVDAAVSNIDIPDVDLSGYYTKTEVDALIPEEVDLTDYALKSDIPDVSEFISEIPSEYVTETELNEAINGIEVTGGGVGKAGRGAGAEIFNDYDTNAAYGYYSHAEGNATKTNGHASHAEGKGTIAEYAYTHVQGTYNKVDVKNSYDGIATKGTYAHIVGNGTSDSARSNAHTLDWEGNAWFAGNVYVGGTSMDDATMIGAGGGLTEEQVNTLISNALADIGVAEQGAY